TGTKTDANPLTWQDIRDITASVSIPTTAIGGIKLDNMLELQGTGVDGVAIVSGIFAAEDIETTTKALLAQARKLVLP
ncbi:MAG: thiamine phosphate synthase, partial [Butyricicoccus sp.]|nr:thiamine phosphate synthase [Butyricicoccus sp.]